MSTDAEKNIGTSDEGSKKERKKRFKAGSLLLLGFFVMYIPSIFNWIYGSNVTTDILRNGSIEESYNVQSYIIRDEVLLDASPFNGKYIIEAAEGERVPVLGNVATVLENSSLDLLDKLDKKNMEIAEAQNQRAKNTDLYSEDISKIQDSIDENVSALVLECTSNSFNGIGTIRENINKLIEKRAEIVSTGSNDSTLVKLKKERDDIQKRINASTKHIITKNSGIVSYVIDGCEQQLTPAAIGSLLPKNLEAVKPKYEMGGSGDSAEAGKTFVKVIRGNYMYLAAVMDKQKAELLKNTGNIKIRINDIDKIYPAVVNSVSAAANGKCVITVKLDRGLEELSNVRKVNIDFIQEMYEGLEIPLRCFKSIEKDGKTGIIVVVKANVTYYRTVKILGRDSEFAIIKTPDGEDKKTVSLYDSYIVEPRNVEEGQIINQ